VEPSTVAVEKKIGGSGFAPSSHSSCAGDESYHHLQNQGKSTNENNFISSPHICICHFGRKD
jgi:hypothetical protein